MLLPKLADARPLVRSITCWSLSRYARWLVQAAREAGAVGVAQFDSVLAVRTSPGLVGAKPDPWQAAREAGMVGGAQLDSMLAVRSIPPAAFCALCHRDRPSVACQVAHLLPCLGHWSLSSLSGGG